ncbi:ANTAR domain-containing protein [Streptomyces sp. Ac-502]|uniref:ANTAR domain-containing protein n=1 Tax=Streptomyces sp. Ac-502 TaxID=3342801 RepID=UPI0038623D20
MPLELARDGGNGERALADGIRAVFALPVWADPHSPDGAGLVWSLYRDAPGPLSRTDLHTARDHADAAALLTTAAVHTSRGAGVRLPPHEAVVHQATGMISYRHEVTPDQALDLLRGHAYARGIDLAELAHHIVHGHRTLPH